MKKTVNQILNYACRPEDCATNNMALQVDKSNKVK